MTARDFSLRPMRVQFLNPPAFTDPGNRYRLNPPLAPAILAGVFRRAGHEASAADMECLGVSPETLAARFAESRAFWPDAVGFTVCSFNASGAQRCVQALRGVGYDGYIALGGPHITMLGRGPVDELESWGADAWVVGECEGNVVRVFEHGQRGLIEGVACPIGEVPAPAWEVHSPSITGMYCGNEPFTGHPEAITMWSRGCPHRCIFCSNIVYGRQPTRRRPPENILAELQTLRAMGVKSLYVYDDELVGMGGAHNAWLEAVCGSVAPLGFTWKAQARVSEVHTTLSALQAMHAAGCRYLQWGVESFSESVLRALRKGTTEDDIEASLRRAKQAGIQSGLFLMVGNPGETPDDLEWTCQRLREYRREGLYSWAQVMVLTPMPGTPLYARAVSEGWYKAPPNERMVGAYMDTPTMRAADIERWRLRLLDAASGGFHPPISSTGIQP